MLADCLGLIATCHYPSPWCTYVPSNSEGDDYKFKIEDSQESRGGRSRRPDNDLVRENELCMCVRSASRGKLCLPYLSVS